MATEIPPSRNRTSTEMQNCTKHAKTACPCLLYPEAYRAFQNIPKNGFYSLKMGTVFVLLASRPDCGPPRFSLQCLSLSKSRVMHSFVNSIPTPHRSFQIGMCCHFNGYIVPCSEVGSLPSYGLENSRRRSQGREIFLQPVVLACYCVLATVAVQYMLP